MTKCKTVDGKHAAANLQIYFDIVTWVKCTSIIYEVLNIT